MRDDDDRPGLAAKQCSGLAWTHCATICDYCRNPGPVCADCGLREPSGKSPYCVVCLIGRSAGR